MVEIGLGVIGYPRTFGKAVDDGLAHGLPHQADAAGIRGSFFSRQCKVEAAAERIRFPDRMAGGLHGGDDLVGYPVAANVAERPGEPPGNNTLSAVEQRVKDIGRVGDLREHRVRIDRMGPEKALGHVDQCRRQPEQAQAVLYCHLVFGRHSETHFENGGAEQELGREKTGLVVFMGLLTNSDPLCAPDNEGKDCSP